jgi:imidazoleglycerol phosphate synthase cyclase subunit
MLTVRIIPCLDVSNGRVVKGIKFQDLRDAGLPAELAKNYEQDGADELVILDVSATPERRGTQLDVVRAVRANISIPLCVGGGVRNAEAAFQLLNAGADKVGINTAAVENPAILGELAARFGRQCVVLAIDAAASGDNRWEVVTRSGKNRTGLDAVKWAEAAAKAGAGEILLTSWDRDGTKQGYDLALISAISGVVDVPIIASGGAAVPEHMSAAVKAGADAVLAASIFHHGEYTVDTLKISLARLGVEVRQ